MRTLWLRSIRIGPGAARSNRPEPGPVDAARSAFVATGVVSAVIVDSVRLTVYGVSYFIGVGGGLAAGLI